MSTGLEPHALRVKFEDGRDEQLIACAGGFMEVTPEKVTVLATAAEAPVDIDVNRAQKAFDRARERLEKFKTGTPEVKQSIDEKRAELALLRAMARLKASGTEYSL